MNLAQPLKEEKQYVLGIVEECLAEGRESAIKEYPRLSDMPDKELDKFIERSTSYWEKANETIEISFNSTKYKIGKIHSALLQVKKNVNSAYRNHSDKVTRPSMKPTGKPIADIIKEMEDEVDRYWRDRESLKNWYEYNTGKGLKEAEADYEKWKDLHSKYLDNKITLKSLTPLFHKAPSGKELIQRYYATYDRVKFFKKRATELKEEIKEAYPSLYREMFENGKPLKRCVNE